MLLTRHDRAGTRRTEAAHIMPIVAVIGKLALPYLSVAFRTLHQRCWPRALARQFAPVIKERVVGQDRTGIAHRPAHGAGLHLLRRGLKLDKLLHPFAETARSE